MSWVFKNILHLKNGSGEKSAAVRFLKVLLKYAKKFKLLPIKINNVTKLTNFITYNGYLIDNQSKSE